MHLEQYVIRLAVKKRLMLVKCGVLSSYWLVDLNTTSHYSAISTKHFLSEKKKEKGYSDSPCFISTPIFPSASGLLSNKHTVHPKMSDCFFTKPSIQSLPHCKEMSPLVSFLNVSRIWLLINTCCSIRGK